MRPGVLATALMLAVFAELFFARQLRIRSLPDIIATVFFLYEILSVIWLTAGGFPFSVFAQEFISSVLPMVFYFVGKSAKDDCGRWYKFYLIAMIILGVLGIALYAFAPQFYNDWSYVFSYTSKADAATTRVRMNSVVGSTCLSFNMVAGMMIAAWFLKSKDQQNALRIRKVQSARQTRKVTWHLPS